MYPDTKAPAPWHPTDWLNGEQAPQITLPSTMLSEHGAKRRASLGNTQTSEPPTRQKAPLTSGNSTPRRVKKTLIKWDDPARVAREVERIEAEKRARSERVFQGYAKRRAERMEMREEAGRILGVGHRITACGRTIVSNDGASLKLATTEHGTRAHFANVSTCGNAAACPVCAVKVAGKRQHDFSALLTQALATVDGGQPRFTVFFTTHTLRHNAKMTLEDIQTKFQEVHRAVYNGRAWDLFKKRSGWVSAFRFMEATHGRAGWHVHSHSVHIFRNADAKTTPEENREWLAGRWYKETQKHKGFGVSLARGTDTKVVKLGDNLAKYLSKQGLTTLAGEHAEGLALESAGGAFKRGRSKNRTPMQILADCTRAFRLQQSRKLTARETRKYLQDRAIYREWVESSAGRKMFITSGDTSGLRDELNLGAEPGSDEELAQEEVEGAPLATIPNFIWHKARPHLATILDAAERLDADPFYLYGVLRGVGLEERYMRAVVSACEVWDEQGEGSPSPEGVGAP